MIKERNRNGTFAVGNSGGPGRPRKSEETHRHFLSTVAGIIQNPERFSKQQREALVRLVTSLALDGPDHQAIAAATVLVEMNGVDMENDRKSSV